MFLIYKGRSRGTPDGAGPSTSQALQTSVRYFPISDAIQQIQHAEPNSPQRALDDALFTPMDNNNNNNNNIDSSEGTDERPISSASSGSRSSSLLSSPPISPEACGKKKKKKNTSLHRKLFMKKFNEMNKKK